MPTDPHQSHIEGVWPRTTPTPVTMFGKRVVAISVRLAAEALGNESDQHACMVCTFAMERLREHNFPEGDKLEGRGGRDVDGNPVCNYDHCGIGAAYLTEAEFAAMRITGVLPDHTEEFINARNKSTPAQF